MIEIPNLYDHQATMRDDLRKALAKDQRVILCAPPGTGKTRLAKWILGSYLNREKKAGESGYAMFAVHRRGLVDNASDSFSECPSLPHGLIMSGRETSPTESLQVASIDTKNSWYCEGGKYDTDMTYDLVIFDEVHAHCGKLRTFLTSHDAKRESLGLNPTFVVGLSATPQHKELSQIFRRIVEGPSTSWLIENGYLSPFRYFQCTQGKLDALVKRGDEYTVDSVSNAMEGLSGDLVRDWKKHAYGRATVGFFPRRSHAKEAMKMLNDNGVIAKYVDGNTPDDERRGLFAQLNHGEIDYICNVGVVERGTDIPRVSCVQLCTAVGSVVRYRQMIGRGSRMHPTKTECIVLDHAANVRNHGFFEDDIEWTLEWGQRPSKDHTTRATIQCPSCGSVYRGGKCRCGYEPTPNERKSQGLEFTGGELKEINRKDRKKPKNKTNEMILIEALFKAGRLGLSFGGAWHIARETAEKQGTKFRVPSTFEVSGNVYRSIPYGNPDSKRRVRDTYGFTVGKHSNDDNPYKT